MWLTVFTVVFLIAAALSAYAVWLQDAPPLIKHKSWN